MLNEIKLNYLIPTPMDRVPASKTQATSVLNLPNRIKQSRLVETLFSWPNLTYLDKCAIYRIRSHDLKTACIAEW